MKMSIVIVGASQAGLKVAERLRAVGVDDPIVMIGDEPHLPYQRPPLSKKYLLGEIGDEHLMLAQDSLFEKLGVDLRLGRRVTRIETDRDAVILDDGTALPFGTLVLATGSAPRPLKVAGADQLDVHMIRTLDDALRLRALLPSIGSVAVIGGGYIGLEAASALRSAGKDVTIVEMQERLLVRALCPVVSGYLLKLHQSRGVTFKLGVALEKIAPDGAGAHIHLGDGTTLSADVVIAAIGGVANDALASESGIDCNNGIIVDQLGMTSRPNVYAAGDCARFWSKRYGVSVRLESVQNANDQARAVAEVIAGQTVDYDPVPWFWSDQYDTKLQMAGLSQGFDRSEQEGDPESGAFALTYWRDGRMLAVSAINNARAFMMGRRQLERDHSTA